ncbi:MAG TPA: hypothetical protein PL084_09700 [Chitinophagales bacterium]|nr:hypothetical protein [Chitinophagales bacterium]HRP39320.1 hypothetical protein [Chitinophagales bacterium]
MDEPQLSANPISPSIDNSVLLESTQTALFRVILSLLHLIEYAVLSFFTLEEMVLVMNLSFDFF